MADLLISSEKSKRSKPAISELLAGHRGSAWFPGRAWLSGSEPYTGERRDVIGNGDGSGRGFGEAPTLYLYPRRKGVVGEGQGLGCGLAAGHGEGDGYGDGTNGGRGFGGGYATRYPAGLGSGFGGRLGVGSGVGLMDGLEPMSDDGGLATVFAIENRWMFVYGVGDDDKDVPLEEGDYDGCHGADEWADWEDDVPVKRAPWGFEDLNEDGDGGGLGNGRGAACGSGDGNGRGNGRGDGNGNGRGTGVGFG